jgi:hypothetical protein
MPGAPIVALLVAHLGTLGGVSTVALTAGEESVLLMGNHCCFLVLVCVFPLE